jgi:ABC-type multidrug transport system fused ATPase/permease subunit
MNLKSIRAKSNVNIVVRASKLLSKKDQRKILIVIVIQIFLGGLDLIGVAIMGVLGALAVNGVSSRAPGGRVNGVLEFLGIADNTFQFQAAVLGSVAVLFLIGRTVFSIIFTRRILFFLSRRGAEVSKDLVSKLLAQPLLTIQTRSSQENLYAVTYGVSSITLGILGTAITLFSDSALLVVLGAGLFIVDPLLSLGTFLVFSFIAFLLYKVMHTKVLALGQKQADLNVKSNSEVLEVLNSYREAVVRNRRYYYVERIGVLREDLANTLAELSFMPNISKYVIESTVIVGALVISAVQFMLQDATHAVATLAIFLAAGSRIAPAVLRIQQGALQIKGSVGNAGPTLDLIDSLDKVLPSKPVATNMNFEYSNFESSIAIENVSFAYPSSNRKALIEIDLRVKEGSSLAIVGPSGAGKTTLIDLLLGIIEPDTGTTFISGMLPLEAIEKWPGAISYVPQDVLIVDGTIRENVALGYLGNVLTDESLWKVLKIANLDNFVRGQQAGLDSYVGERGTKISGGQRQRLGIARAMFTNPKLLVLDEATSSLDSQTEEDISVEISNLKGSVTTVMIAHRLSTVKNADQVVYMEDGRIIAAGTFEEVRKIVPNFDKQAALIGL